MSRDAVMVDYYSQRAREYERIYEKPERQQDLAELKELLRDALRGRHVMEVACGTGYWTEVAAGTAASIAAFDINESALEIARLKPLDHAKVTFAVGDAFRIAKPAGPFGAAFAMFWGSHIPKAALSGFLRQLHETLEPGAIVVFADNTFVPGESTPISRSDGEGNTYQTRRLDSGKTFEVLKNFPTDHELHELLRGSGEQIEIKRLRYYWWLSYRFTGSH